MAQEYLEFERPIAELEKKIEELTLFTSNGGIDLEEEILKLHKKSDQLRAVSRFSYQGYNDSHGAGANAEPDRLG